MQRLWKETVELWTILGLLWEIVFYTVYGWLMRAVLAMMRLVIRR